MTAAVEVDDPLVEQVARAIALKKAEAWGLQFGADHGFVASEKERLTPAVREVLAALKEMGRLLPEGVTRREVLTLFDGKTRAPYGPVDPYPPRVDQRTAWIERHIVWETTPERPGATS